MWRVILLCSATGLVASKLLIRKNNLKARVFDEDGLQDLKYIVALANPNFIRFCTGTLVHSQWVLSAAHCVDDVTEFDVLIWYKNFTVFPKETGYYSEVLKIVIHSSYKQLSQNMLLGCQHDIALLYLKRVELTPAKLSGIDYRSLPGHSVTYITSHTVRKNIKDVTARKPTKASGIIIKCDKNDRAMKTVAPIICVAPDCLNKDHPQFGDSGGPLIHDGKVAGVLAILSVNAVVISGYTPVSAYIDWINVVINAT